NADARSISVSVFMDRRPIQGRSLGCRGTTYFGSIGACWQETACRDDLPGPVLPGTLVGDLSHGFAEEIRRCILWGWFRVRGGQPCGAVATHAGDSDFAIDAFT